MQYVKGTPYFCHKVEYLKQYKYLSEDITTDILIVDGGICGAILNYYLSQKYDVTLIDKGRIGQNCTSCATAILEYQLDDFYDDLKKLMTEQEIIEVYKMGQNSIKKIEKFIKKYGNKCKFSKRPSFIYSQNASNNAKMKKEFTLRKSYGFDCELYTRSNTPPSGSRILTVMLECDFSISVLKLLQGLLYTLKR